MITIMSESWLRLLDTLDGRELALPDAHTLFRTRDPVRYVYVVRSGCIRLERVQASGEPLVLQRALPGQLTAEASLFASHYHCDAVASGNTRVWRVPKADVLKLQEQNAAWLRAFAAHLASEVQRMRARAQLLSLKRVEARLDAWLTLNGGTLPERGSWLELAAELAITPEALYRELSRRHGQVHRRAGAASRGRRQ